MLAPPLSLSPEVSRVAECAICPVKPGFLAIRGPPLGRVQGSAPRPGPKGPPCVIAAVVAGRLRGAREAPPFMFLQEVQG